jgi:hypothetical protein
MIKLFKSGDAVLFGLLGGAGSFDSFQHNRSFLVNRIGIGGGRRFRSVYVFFDDGDLGVLVLFLTMLTFHSAVHNDGQDKEHPEKNSNSATKDEGNGSTFPTTQIHKGVVDAINEGSFTEAVAVVAAVTMAVAVTTVGTRSFRMLIRHIGNAFHSVGANKNSGGSDERQDLNLAIIMTARLDEREAESLSEKVGDLYCFLVEAMGSARTGPHLSSLTLDLGPDSMTKTHSDRCVVLRNHQKRDRKDLGNACSSYNSRKT